MLGIISDIHGNLEALEAVVRQGKAEGVESWNCLGDVVGYGANPNECVELVADLCDVVLLGNHDEAALDDRSPFGFNPWARAAVLWTHNALTAESIAFLSDLPFRHETDRATYVHSTPLEPQFWDYILTERDAREHAPGFTTPLCFIGHVHRPATFRVPPVEHGDEDRWIINVGSVGQPRDHDSRACLVVWDQSVHEGNGTRLVRVPYDVEKAQRKIRDAGLPRPLAERLAVGA